MWRTVRSETHGFPTTPVSHLPSLLKSHRKKIRFGSETLAVNSIVSPSNVVGPPYGPPASTPPALGSGPEVVSVRGRDFDAKDTVAFCGRYAGSIVSGS